MSEERDEFEEAYLAYLAERYQGNQCTLQDLRVLRTDSGYSADSASLLVGAWWGWQAARQSAGATRQEPVATVKDADEYGPIIEWKKHWVELIGANLYAAPIGDNGANFAIYRDVESGLLVLIDSFDGTSSSVRIGSIRESRPLKDFVDAQPDESRRVEFTEDERADIRTAAAIARHSAHGFLADRLEALARAQAKGE